LSDSMTPKTDRPEILVVDDTPSSLQMLTELLSDKGYLVRTASSGSLALQSVAAKLPDLILLDVRMPVMNGFEVCRELKADKHSVNVPVIFISAFDEIEEKVKAFQVGGIDFISKPIETEEVLARVNTQLQLKVLTERQEEMVRQRTDALSVANQQLHKANLAYKALSDCSQMLIRATEEKVLLQEICRIVAEDCGYKLVWIGYAEHDQAKTVRPVAQAGFETGYLDAVKFVWNDTELGRGPTGRAIREKKPVINHDLRNNPDFAPWREEAIRRGYVSSAALPLVTGSGEILGAMNVYATGADAFSAEEINLLAELADNLAFGLKALRLRIDHAQAEASLKESEELHRITISNILDPVFITTDTGQFTFICPNIPQILGFSIEEIQSLGNISKLLGDDLFSLKELQESGEIHNIERVITDKSGSDRFYLITLRQVDIKGGTILYTCHDITDLKQAEEERKKLQNQLLHAQKMESVGRLAGGVAHDFNNMLGIILGHTELALKRGKPTQPIHGALEEIRRAGQHAAELTRQLLTFARKQAASPRILDLNKILPNTLKMLSRLIGEDINIVCKPGLDLWPVRMDPGQVDQILTNLVINARDAIAGVGKVTIETANIHFDEVFCSQHECFTPGDYVQLTVRDDGCGMSEEVLDKLFDPFYTTKELGQGTGLGLSIVYGIVKQNEGYVKVTSTPGKGTTFKIYLPHCAGSGDIVFEEDPPAELAGGSEMILLVEDEEALLILVRQMLESLGYRVLSAATAKDALSLAKANCGKIDLVITDVVIPDMTGYDLSRNLLTRYPEMKRLWMTGHTGRAISRQEMPEQEKYFLTKPFSLTELSKKVREILDDRE